MALEEIGDYPEKMTEFELHWASVNQSLGGTPATDFLLLGGYDRADFIADKAAIVAALSNQEGLNNNLDFARSDRDVKRADLRQRLILFRNRCKADLPDSRYLRALPATPPEQSEQQKLLDAWDDMAHIWEQINTDQPAEIAPALTLRGGYTLAQFQTELTEMRGLYDAVKAAERADQDGRGTRDELLDAARQRMVQYRERLPLVLDPGDPLLASMPRLSSQPGSTPVALVLDGEFDTATNEAVLTWNESSDPNLSGYQVRMTPGPEYDSEVAIVIGNLPPGVLTHRAVQGVWAPGDTGTYKVFVILTTGNEAGSNSVTLTRPTNP